MDHTGQGAGRGRGSGRQTAGGFGGGHPGYQTAQAGGANAANHSSGGGRSRAGVGAGGSSRMGPVQTQPHGGQHTHTGASSLQDSAHRNPHLPPPTSAIPPAASSSNNYTHAPSQQPHTGSSYQAGPMMQHHHPSAPPMHLQGQGGHGQQPAHGGHGGAGGGGGGMVVSRPVHGGSTNSHGGHGHGGTANVHVGNLHGGHSHGAGGGIGTAAAGGHHSVQPSGALHGRPSLTVGVPLEQSEGGPGGYSHPPHSIAPRGSSGGSASLASSSHQQFQQQQQIPNYADPATPFAIANANAELKNVHVEPSAYPALSRHDVMVQEALWMSTDVAEERRWKASVSLRLCRHSRRQMLMKNLKELTQRRKNGSCARGVVPQPSGMPIDNSFSAAAASSSSMVPLQAHQLGLEAAPSAPSSFPPPHQNTAALGRAQANDHIAQTASPPGGRPFPHPPDPPPPPLGEMDDEEAELEPLFPCDILPAPPVRSPMHNPDQQQPSSSAPVAAEVLDRGPMPTPQPREEALGSYSSSAVLAGSGLLGYQFGGLGFVETEAETTRKAALAAVHAVAVKRFYMGVCLRATGGGGEGGDIAKAHGARITLLKDGADTRVLQPQQQQRVSDVVHGGALDVSAITQRMFLRSLRPILDALVSLSPGASWPCAKTKTHQLERREGRRDRVKRQGGQVEAGRESVVTDEDISDSRGVKRKRESGGIEDSSSRSAAANSCFVVGAIGTGTLLPSSSSSSAPVFLDSHLNNNSRVTAPCSSLQNSFHSSDRKNGSKKREREKLETERETWRRWTAEQEIEEMEREVNDEERLEEDMGDLSLPMKDVDKVIYGGASSVPVLILREALRDLKRERAPPVSKGSAGMPPSPSPQGTVAKKRNTFAAVSVPGGLEGGDESIGVLEGSSGEGLGAGQQLGASSGGEGPVPTEREGEGSKLVGRNSVGVGEIDSEERERLQEARQTGKDLSLMQMLHKSATERKLDVMGPFGSVLPYPPTGLGSSAGRPFAFGPPSVARPVCPGSPWLEGARKPRLIQHFYKPHRRHPPGKAPKEDEPILKLFQQQRRGPIDYTQDPDMQPLWGPLSCMRFAEKGHHDTETWEPFQMYTDKASVTEIEKRTAEIETEQEKFREEICEVSKPLPWGLPRAPLHDLRSLWKDSQHLFPIAQREVKRQILQAILLLMSGTDFTLLFLLLRWRKIRSEVMQAQFQLHALEEKEKEKEGDGASASGGGGGKPAQSAAELKKAILEKKAQRNELAVQLAGRLGGEPIFALYRGAGLALLLEWMCNVPIHGGDVAKIGFQLDEKTFSLRSKIPLLGVVWWSFTACSLEWSEAFRPFESIVNAAESIFCDPAFSVRGIHEFLEEVRRTDPWLYPWVSVEADSRRMAEQHGRRDSVDPLGLCHAVPPSPRVQDRVGSFSVNAYVSPLSPLSGEGHPKALAMCLMGQTKKENEKRALRGGGAASLRKWWKRVASSSGPPMMPLSSSQHAGPEAAAAGGGRERDEREDGVGAEEREMAGRGGGIVKEEEGETEAEKEVEAQFLVTKQEGKSHRPVKKEEEEEGVKGGGGKPCEGGGAHKREVVSGKHKRADGANIRDECFESMSQSDGIEHSNVSFAFCRFHLPVPLSCPRNSPPPPLTSDTHRESQIHPEAPLASEERGKDMLPSSSSSFSPRGGRFFSYFLASQPAAVTLSKSATKETGAKVKEAKPVSEGGAFASLKPEQGSKKEFFCVKEEEEKLRQLREISERLRTFNQQSNLFAPPSHSPLSLSLPHSQSQSHAPSEEAASHAPSSGTAFVHFPPLSQNFMRGAPAVVSAETGGGRGDACLSFASLLASSVLSCLPGLQKTGQAGKTKCNKRPNSVDSSRASSQDHRGEGSEPGSTVGAWGEKGAKKARQQGQRGGAGSGRWFLSLTPYDSSCEMMGEAEREKEKGGKQNHAATRAAGSGGTARVLRSQSVHDTIQSQPVDAASEKGKGGRGGGVKKTQQREKEKGTGGGGSSRRGSVSISMGGGGASRGGGRTGSRGAGGGGSVSVCGMGVEQSAVASAPSSIAPLAGGGGSGSSDEGGGEGDREGERHEEENLAAAEAHHRRNQADALRLPSAAGAAGVGVKRERETRSPPLSAVHSPRMSDCLPPPPPAERYSAASPSSVDSRFVFASLGPFLGLGGGGSAETFLSFPSCEEGNFMRSLVAPAAGAQRDLSCRASTRAEIISRAVKEELGLLTGGDQRAAAAGHSSSSSSSSSAAAAVEGLWAGRLFGESRAMGGSVEGARFFRRAEAEREKKEKMKQEEKTDDTEEEKRRAASHYSGNLSKEDGREARPTLSEHRVGSREALKGNPWKRIALNEQVSKHWAHRDRWSRAVDCSEARQQTGLLTCLTSAWRDAERRRVAVFEHAAADLAASASASAASSSSSSSSVSSFQQQEHLRRSVSRLSQQQQENIGKNAQQHQQQQPGPYVAVQRPRGLPDDAEDTETLQQMRAAKRRLLFDRALQRPSAVPTHKSQKDLPAWSEMKRMQDRPLERVSKQQQQQQQQDEKQRERERDQINVVGATPATATGAAAAAALPGRGRGENAGVGVVSQPASAAASWPQPHGQGQAQQQKTAATAQEEALAQTQTQLPGQQRPQGPSTNPPSPPSGISPLQSMQPSPSSSTPSLHPHTPTPPPIQQQQRQQEAHQLSRGALSLSSPAAAMGLIQQKVSSSSSSGSTPPSPLGRGLVFIPVPILPPILEAVKNDAQKENEHLSVLPDPSLMAPSKKFWTKLEVMAIPGMGSASSASASAGGGQGGGVSRSASGVGVGGSMTSGRDGAWGRRGGGRRDSSQSQHTAGTESEAGGSLSSGGVTWAVRCRAPGCVMLEWVSPSYYHTDQERYVQLMRAGALSRQVDRDRMSSSPPLFLSLPGGAAGPVGFHMGFGSSSSSSPKSRGGKRKSPPPVLVPFLPQAMVLRERKDMFPERYPQASWKVTRSWEPHEVFALEHDYFFRMLPDTARTSYFKNLFGPNDAPLDREQPHSGGRPAWTWRHAEDFMRAAVELEAKEDLRRRYERARDEQLASTRRNAWDHQQSKAAAAAGASLHGGRGGTHYHLTSQVQGGINPLQQQQQQAHSSQQHTGAGPGPHSHSQRGGYAHQQHQTGVHGGAQSVASSAGAQAHSLSSISGQQAPPHTHTQGHKGMGSQSGPQRQQSKTLADLKKNPNPTLVGPSPSTAAAAGGGGGGGPATHAATATSTATTQQQQPRFNVQIRAPSSPAAPQPHLPGQVPPASSVSRPVSPSMLAMQNRQQQQSTNQIALGHHAKFPQGTARPPSPRGASARSSAMGGTGPRLPSPSTSAAGPGAQQTRPPHSSARGPSFPGRPAAAGPPGQPGGPGGSQSQAAPSTQQPNATAGQQPAGQGQTTGTAAPPSSARSLQVPQGHTPGGAMQAHPHPQTGGMPGVSAAATVTTASATGGNQQPPMQMPSPSPSPSPRPQQQAHSIPRPTLITPAGPKASSPMPPHSHGNNPTTSPPGGSSGHAPAPGPHRYQPRAAQGHPPPNNQQQPPHADASKGGQIRTSSLVGGGVAGQPPNSSSPQSPPTHAHRPPQHTQAQPGATTHPPRPPVQITPQHPTAVGPTGGRGTPSLLPSSSSTSASASTSNVVPFGGGAQGNGATAAPVSASASLAGAGTGPESSPPTNTHAAAAGPNPATSAAAASMVAQTTNPLVKGGAIAPGRPAASPPSESVPPLASGVSPAAVVSSSSPPTPIPPPVVQDHVARRAALLQQQQQAAAARPQGGIAVVSSPSASPTINRTIPNPPSMQAYQQQQRMRQQQQQQQQQTASSQSVPAQEGGGGTAGASGPGGVVQTLPLQSAPGGLLGSLQPQQRQRQPSLGGFPVGTGTGTGAPPTRSPAAVMAAIRGLSAQRPSAAAAVGGAGGAGGAAATFSSATALPPTPAASSSPLPEGPPASSPQQPQAGGGGVMSTSSHASAEPAPPYSAQTQQQQGGQAGHNKAVLTPEGAGGGAITRETPEGGKAVDPPHAEAASPPQSAKHGGQPEEQPQNGMP